MSKTQGDLLFNGCKKFIVDLLGEDQLDSVMKDAYKRYDELIEENKDEPKAMDPHTKARIYPAISVFESLLKAGCTREQAAQVIYDHFDYSAKKGAKFLQTLLKIPGLYKKVPSFACKMIHKSFGADAGFQAQTKKLDRTGMHVDMLVCPYHQICQRYGCPEIVKAFCHSDDVAYGHMHPRLIWERTQTLGRGGECCDFIIDIQEKEG